MAVKSYESLLQQVQKLIDNAVPGGVTITSKNAITDLARSEATDFGYIIKGISDALGDIIESRIISGLDVTATTPPSATVNITAGKGTAAGRLYELEEDTTINIEFNSSDYIFFIVLSEKRLIITTTVASDQCAIAKIIVPQPGTTSAIEDDKPNDSYNAYIVSAKDVVFDEDQEFDDASVEKLRDVIGDVLADNLIGNIRLSENLKITNTLGTVELDSNSMKIKDVNDATLAKFDRNGTFFYDPAGRLMAKFASDEAYIGNILITKNSIQTRNFVSGTSGFQIKDSGDVEFNDGTFRGTLNANIGNIGGWTLASDEMYATTTGTIKTSLNAGAGANGVVLDKDGLRVYDDVLGEVVNLPSDGSAPSFSSGIIRSVIFEINTNAVLRTSEGVGIQADSYTKLLSHFDGINGATAYVDPIQGAYTFVGTAQLNTTQYKFGSASLLLDGNSDCLTLPDSDDWDFGTGDFTIESRINNNSTGYMGIVSSFVQGGTGWALVSSSDGLTPTWINPGGGDSITSSSNFASGWNHVAIVRYGNIITMYLNGVAVGLDDCTGDTVNSGGSGLVLGRYYVSTDNFYLNGWLDEIRISKGIARWTTDFTPQTTAYGHLDAGILINNTGIYGCAANQSLASANLKVLTDGNAYFKGEIQATTGQIGNVTITATGLYGGLIVGSTLRGSAIETSSTVPRVLINQSGISFQTSTAVGSWGDGSLWGDGTLWGSGYLATLFNVNFPTLAILAESTMADIRLYNRSTDPATGTHIIGDLIVTSGDLKICSTGGSPGTFIALSKSGHTHTYAPNNATYICQTANSDLSAEQALSSLTTGIMYVTTSTGVITSLGNPLPIANGGTASATQNFVDLTEAQTVAGTKTFNALKLGGNMDCNDNQATNFIIENRTNDTGMTVTGQLWFRTDV